MSHYPISFFFSHIRLIPYVGITVSRYLFPTRLECARVDSSTIMLHSSQRVDHWKVWQTTTNKRLPTNEPPREINSRRTKGGRRSSERHRSASKGVYIGCTFESTSLSATAPGSRESFFVRPTSRSIHERTETNKRAIVKGKRNIYIYTPSARSEPPAII